MEPVIEIHPGATKWDIRQRVWDHIEDNNLANFPRPVHNRIPNFKGAFTACAKISELQAFAQADVVKVDPDKPLEGARLAILQAQKTLLVPTPRLRTGLFNRITPPQGATKEQLRICSSSQGVRDFSVPVALDAEVKVDLVVVGSVAVSEKGLRIGKGEGFADMEYGMMASMGSVNESTVVVTVVHDCQVVDIPEELIQSHDLTVDYILTPTRVIKTDCQFPKPHGIIWNKLDKERLEKIPILKELRALEEEAGKDVTLGESAVGTEPEQPKRQTRRRPRHNAAKHDAAPEQPKPERTEAERKPRQRPARVRRESRGETERGGRGRRGENAKVSEDGGGDATSPLGSPRKFPASVTTVYLGGIPAGLRVSELKTALREREAAPLRLTWQGAQHRAFLDYSDAHGAEQALKALQDLSLNGHSLQAELAKSQRGGGAAGGGKRSGQSGGRPRPPAKSKTPPTQQQRDAESDGGDNGDGGGDNGDGGGDNGGGGEKPEQ